MCVNGVKRMFVCKGLMNRTLMVVLLIRVFLDGDTNEFLCGTVNRVSGRQVFHNGYSTTFIRNHLGSRVIEFV